MSVSERERNELYLAARERLGDGPAATLMTMLPPVGWADVATKRDLAELEARLEAKITASLERSLRSWSLGLFVGLGGLMASMTAVMVAAIALS